MSQFETRLTDGRGFRPNEWQLNEVIWASVRVPYFEQWQRWQLPASREGSHADIFTANWARAVLFMREHNQTPEDLNNVALNLGKLAAGLSCSVAQLITPPTAWRRSTETWLHQQAATVDSVMTSVEIARPIDLEDECARDDFEEMLVGCHERAMMAPEDEQGLGQTLYEMTVPLFNTAVGTTRTWLDFIKRYDGQFAISPGGTSRAQGEYAKALRKANEHLFVR
jgi:hypothetical protein